MVKFKKQKPETAIGSTHSDTETLTIRGKNTLTEIVGKKTFSETFFFIVPVECQTREKLLVLMHA